MSGYGQCVGCGDSVARVGWDLYCQHCSDEIMRQMEDDWEEQYGERPWEARDAAIRDNERL